MVWRNTEDWNRQRREHHNERERAVTVKELVILHQTDRALLVIEKETMESLAANGESSTAFKKWVPLSQIRGSTIPMKDLDKDDVVDLQLPLWLVQEKGFLYE